MDNDTEESLKKRQEKNPVLGDSSRKNFLQGEDIRLETTRARFANVLKRHGELSERLSRDSDKMIFERLQKEFEAARASQTQVKMTVLEHTVPFFLPIPDAENDLLSSNTMRFIDYVGELLHSYVDRREQIHLLSSLNFKAVNASLTNKLLAFDYAKMFYFTCLTFFSCYSIGSALYHSLPYHMIGFVLDDFDCKVTVSLRYADLVSILPTRIRVFA
ncbi:uncharacterized protein LOC110603325 [Manihot esculenta]|uniref:uncharacterized protein LOC110603325 n=1 Tax=Manihot esculenta TaxID=3983 RepID=UPI001CC56BC3|nr:uncharacterized protein LOC110603325 [Manihot esculenta]